MSLLRREGWSKWWDDGVGGVPNYCSLPQKKKMVVCDSLLVWVTSCQDSGEIAIRSSAQPEAATECQLECTKSSPSNQHHLPNSLSTFPLHSLTATAFLLDVLTTFLASDSERFHDFALVGPHCPKAPRSYKQAPDPAAG